MNRKERRRMKALGLTNNSQFGVRVSMRMARSCEW